MLETIDRVSKERKNLETYFDNIPEKVKEIFTKNLTLSQIKNIGEGKYNDAIDEFTKEEMDINPETNKPFTTEEWNKVIEGIKNDLQIN